MFTNDLKEKNEREIILHEINGAELKLLIDFCYTGIIEINELNVYGLLETATRIEFTRMETKCKEFLLRKMNVLNCLTIWISVEPFTHLNDLVKLAMQYAKVNFVDVVETREFLLLDAERLSVLLKSDNLNVFSEEEVFNAVAKWLDYDEGNRKCHVSNLLSHVRFTHLKSKVSNESYNDFNR